MSERPPGHYDPTDNDESSNLDLSPIERLRKDLKEASVTLSTREARFLVDAYYMVQESRKATGNQLGALIKSDEPHRVIEWFTNQARTLENQIKRALDTWSDSRETGLWAKSIVGIGPVISAGLLAHIDIHKAPSVGKIYRFAGLDPTSKWAKGQLRPWNASLKTICWKVGESFVKVSGREDDFYGKLYIQRKAYEAARSERGELADQAAEKLKNFDIKNKEIREIYESGKFPPGHIHSRAKRFATKIFLSHFHHVLFFNTFGKAPPRPYAIEHLGHVDMIQIPNWPFDPGKDKKKKEPPQ